MPRYNKIRSPAGFIKLEARCHELRDVENQTSLHAGIAKFIFTIRAPGRATKESPLQSGVAAADVEVCPHSKRCLSSLLADLSPFYPGAPELWQHPIAFSAAAELPGPALHHLVHPALHPQLPVRSYL